MIYLLTLFIINQAVALLNQPIRLSPHHGPPSGTAVLISLDTLPTPATPVCMFLDTQVPASNLTLSSFICQAPRYSDYSQPYNSVPVRVSLDGTSFSKRTARFYYDLVQISSISPSSGSVSGNTRVTIHGTGFRKYDTLTCRIDEKNVSLEYMNSYTIVCITNQHEVGYSMVQISMNGIDYYDAGEYEYRNIETIKNTVPKYGPVVGGTKVKLEMDYVYTKNGFCKIGNIISRSLLENGEIYCITPASVKSLNVSYSSNGQNYESSFVFEYYEEVEVSAISPKMVSRKGSKEFYLSGSKFINTGIIQVRVRQSNKVIYISANFESSTSIRFSLNLEEFNAGMVEVSVSLNSQQFSIQRIEIEIFTPPIISKLVPDTGLLTGGIPIQIIGGFFLSINPTCYFGSFTSQGKYLNSTLVICKNPKVLTPQSLSVSLSYNNGIDYSDSLTYTYISPPSSFSYSPTISYNRESSLISLSYTSSISPYLLTISTVPLSTLSSSNSSTTFIMPPMNTGSYSTILYINKYESVNVGVFKFQGECEVGYSCPMERFSKIPCPAGYYCNTSSLISPIPCSSGYYSPNTQSLSCTLCDLGKYCPYVRMKNSLKCPDGYLCTMSGLGTLSKLTVCGRGMSCRNNVSEECGDRYWCGPGTVMSNYHIYNDFRTPQTCRDGIVCLKGKSLTPAGTYNCPISYYCKKGAAFECPIGYYCSYEGLRDPQPCESGFYNPNTKQSLCTPCSRGKICPGDKNTSQQICHPGYVCIHPGRGSPSHICPAGNYCLAGRDSLDITTLNGPKPCEPATFCLIGVKSPLVVISDVSYAQNCIQGTYCELGTDSPAAKACPAGSYCPSAVSVAIPAGKGQYSKGLGNSIATPCPPGRYSNSLGMTECNICPGGYYCPEEGTIVPIMCSAGSYRPEDPSYVFCALCPQGTWSDTPGLSSENECKACEARLVCTEEGMTSLSAADDCPEGYICGERTTSFSMLNNPCPGGFWCNTRTSLPEHFGICDPGYYCPEATAASSRYQHLCLQGYYCPPGTNAALNEEGEFSYIERADYMYVIKAKEEAKANANCTEAGQVDCDMYEIPSFNTCEEDLDIPEPLRIAYTSLKCPDGTSSQLGADCIGKCVSLGSAYIYKFINPLISSSSRFLESTNLTLITVQLEPNSLALLKFDWTNVDIYFKYMSHFSLFLRDANNIIQSFPDYLSPSSPGSKHTNFTISVLNYSPDPTSFKLELALHNSIFDPFSFQLENTLNLTLHNPSRAISNSDDMFVIIIAESDFLDMDLPYNLVDLDLNDQASRSPMLIDIGSNEEYNGTRYDVAPWDETFWVIYQVSTVAMSWLPFFMNCEEFGNHVYFYGLVEIIEKCNLVSEESTQPVEPIPITGWNPTADECELMFKCYYAEDVTVTRSKAGSWYDIEEDKVLFYMTKEPYSRTVFFEARAGTDLDSIFTENVKDLSDNIIPVTFRPDTSAVGGIPTTVELKIRYYQITPTVKKLISVEVLLQDYSIQEVSSPFPSYNLKVSYKALSWFDLLNSFELGIPVYMLIFIILVTIILIIIIVFYYLHLLIFKFKDPPAIHFRMYLASSAIPPALGTIYGSIPIFVMLFILVAVRDEEILKGLAGNWMNMTDPDPDQIIINTRGRIGLILFIMGIVLLVTGSKLLIPIPRDSEENSNEDFSMVDNSVTEIQDETIKQHSKQPSEDMNKEGNSDRKTSFDIESETIEEKEERSDEEYLAMMRYKKRFFIVVSVFLAMVTTFKMELSYSDVFTKNILVFLFFFQICDIIINLILSRFILNEALLVSPFLASLALNEIIMTIAADTFTNFIQCYLFWLGILIFQRLYIVPFLEYFETKLQQFAIFLMKRSVLAERLFKHAVLRQLEMKRSLLTNFTRVSAAEGKNMEGLLITMVNYSSSIQAVFMAPFVLVFILYFADETQIPKNYQIQQQDVAYYLLFNVLIIVPQLLIDIMMFHLLESIYGYKMFDYFTYCSYRFRTRRQSWIYEANEKLDRSLLLPWRSIDKMSYSSQYYFSVTLASWGIMCLTIGWTILLRNKFNPFADPAFFILLILIIVVGIPFKLVLEKLAKALGIWQPNAHQVFIQEIPEEDEAVVQLIDDYAEENALLAKIQTGLFKSKFLQKNKIWLIENVDKLARENYTSHEQLKQIYQQIMNYHAQQEKAQREVEETQEKFLALPHHREREELDITQEDAEIKVDKYHPDPDSTSIRLTNHWLNSARLILNLKKAVIPLHEVALEDECNKCESRDQLRLITLRSFYEIYDRYREDYKGFVITIDRWKKYYYIHQKYTTLCIDCAYIAQLAVKQDPRTAGHLTKIAYLALKSLKPNEKRDEYSSSLKKIAVLWLIGARSNIRRKEEQIHIDNSMNTINSSFYTVSFAVSEVEEEESDS
jgi:hypothetical protein